MFNQLNYFRKKHSPNSNLNYLGASLKYCSRIDLLVKLAYFITSLCYNDHVHISNLIFAQYKMTVNQSIPLQAKPLIS